MAADRITMLDKVIETDFGQLDLVWEDDGGFDGDWERFFRGQINGLAGAAAGDGVYLHLGRRSGGSPLTIDLLTHEPSLSADGWDDVVEVSFVLPEGRQLRWMTWAGGDGGLLPVAIGNYRLRFSCEGRDRGHEGEFEVGPVDRYLVEVWPSGWRPDAVLRVGSDDARYWHREWGGRR